MAWVGTLVATTSTLSGDGRSGRDNSRALRHDCAKQRRGNKGFTVNKRVAVHNKMAVRR